MEVEIEKRAILPKDHRPTSAVAPPNLLEMFDVDVVRMDVITHVHVEKLTPMST